MYQPMMGQRSQCHYPEWMDTENYALKYGLPTERKVQDAVAHRKRTGF